MRIAFYAPLKSPDHDVPSGDRRMARLLMAAMRAAGHEVSVVSTLRAYGEHDTDQAQIRQAGMREASQMQIAWEQAPSLVPDLWFTYHLYYRAPDWVGPPLARQANIPYVVAEASFAMKRASGVWSMGHEAVAGALRQADRVFTLARGDVAGLSKVPVAAGAIVPLAPFVDVLELQKASATVTRRQARAVLGAAGGGPLLLAVGMMRQRAKLESYRLLAASLGHLDDLDWSLCIVGDGPARGEVERLFAGLSAGRVTFVGEVPAAQMAHLYRAADLFAWPGVGEAYGMVYLEAQSCGLPVVATDSGGVANVVRNGQSGILVGNGDGTAYSAALADLINDGSKRRKLGRRAAHLVAGEHSLEQATRTIDGALQAVMIERAEKRSR